MIVFFIGILLSSMSYKNSYLQLVKIIFIYLLFYCLYYSIMSCNCLQNNVLLPLPLPPMIISNIYIYKNYFKQKQTKKNLYFFSYKNMTEKSQDPVYQQHAEMKQLSKLNMHKRTYIKNIMTTIGKLRQIDDIDKYK